MHFETTDYERPIKHCLGHSTVDLDMIEFRSDNLGLNKKTQIAYGTLRELLCTSAGPCKCFYKFVLFEGLEFIQICRKGVSGD